MVLEVNSSEHILMLCIMATYVYNNNIFAMIITYLIQLILSNAIFYPIFMDLSNEEILK